MSPSDPSPWQPPSPGGAPPPPPPPTRPAAPPPPPGPYGPPGGYPGADYAVAPPRFGPARPPRPATPLGGLLMVAGAVIIGIGCVLPWLEIADQSLNGFDEGPDDVALGPGLIFLAVVVVAMGITTLAAKRILAIAIIGIVASAFCLAASAAQLADYSDFADVPIFDADIGPGLPVTVVGSLLALAGAIVTTAKRRR